MIIYAFIASLLLKHHRHLAANIVMAAYPEHQFKVWRFSKVGRGFWERRYLVPIIHKQGKCVGSS